VQIIDIKKVKGTGNSGDRHKYVAHCDTKLN
jgi:hypothetical protein